jgi:hypothetical protein
MEERDDVNPRETAMNRKLVGSINAVKMVARTIIPRPSANRGPVLQPVISKIKVEVKLSLRFN